MGAIQKIRNEEGNEINSNTSSPVTSSIFAWELEALQTGIEDQFGNPQSKTIEYTIIPKQFDFSITFGGTDFVRNNDIPAFFNFNRTEGLLYELSFDTEADATINFNGQVVGKNQTVLVNANNINILYRSQTTGENKIVWTMKASNDVMRQVTSKIRVSFRR